MLIFPIIEWDFRLQRPQQLARQLVNAGHRVFYMSTSFQIGSDAVITNIEDGVLGVRLPGPPQLSIYTQPPPKELINRAAHAWASLRHRWSIHDAVCLVDFPFWTQLCLRLRETFGWKVIYDCMDEHAGFSHTGLSMLPEEEALIAACDLALASSRILLEKQQRRATKCVLLPNAGEFDHFRFAPPVVPAELSELRRPVIGYYGAISHWFDSELVAKLARQRPQWSFVLIGSTASADLAPMRKMKNIHLLGELLYDVLPAYLHAFDVCIIPFKHMPLTDATNPVKLFEFLSAGKPVVATRLAELAHYSTYVNLASGEAEWLAAIERALGESDPGAIGKRIDFARSQTWDRRARQLEHEIAGLYPLASIIIVTYNNLDYTRLCLRTLCEKTAYPNYEIIIVDNGSTDGTVEWLTEFAAQRLNCSLILNEQNRGFARATNQGVVKARGDIIVFLNNDTVLTYGWLSTLVRHLRDESIGLIGPATNWAGNQSRVPVTYCSLAQLDEFADAYTAAHFNRTFDIPVLAFFCVAARRAVLRAVGELDERFGVGMFEDDDYALRVRQAAYRVVCADDAFVHHWGRASFSKLDGHGYDALFEENLLKFETKWNIKWKGHEQRPWLPAAQLHTSAARKV